MKVESTQIQVLMERMPSSGMLRHVALVSTTVLKACITSIIRVTRIGEVGTMSVLTRTTRHNIQEEGILHSHYHKNLKSYISTNKSVVFKDKGSEQPLRKQPSSKKLAAAARESNANMQQALGQQPKEEEEEEEEEEEYEEETETETESSSEDEDTEALQERRMAREMKLLMTKLKSFKQKEEVARKERHSLRDQLTKQQKVHSYINHCLNNLRETYTKLILDYPELYRWKLNHFKVSTCSVCFLGSF
jgi:flagellar biosynthesis GTPase FlhF